MLDRCWLRTRLHGFPQHTIPADRLRPAAVLVPLLVRDGEDCLLFTRRTEHLPHHAGEISFPGGARHAEDGDLVATALRETEEELGIPAARIEVMALPHPVEDRPEHLEVVAFGRDQWVLVEERDDPLDQRHAVLHREPEKAVAVIVGSGVLHDAPASEYLADQLEGRSGGLRLSDGELVLDLPSETAGPVADDRDREAALSIDESDHPLLDAWPFLLIARTRRFVTAHACHRKGWV